MENTTKCKGCGEQVELFNAGYCETCHNVRVFRGYSRAELKDAFEWVHGSNWKNPISCMIPRVLTAAETAVIEAAVVFFAGCAPTFHVDVKAGCTLVKAVGYYAAVGA